LTDRYRKETQNINRQQHKEPQEKKSQDFDKLSEDIDKMRLEAAQNLEGWRRMQADFANYKKRIDNERADMAGYYKSEAVNAFLPVADDLERALHNVPNAIAKDPWFKGFSMLQNSFDKALSQNKTEVFGKIGDEFDPNLHQAVMEESGPSGQVIKVFVKGYRMGERILRHATVSVGSGQ